MTYETNYLAHHGILGQKWGVRRFQNPDGSLTSAGKKRYSGLESIVSTKENKLPGYVKKDGYTETKMPGNVRYSIKKSAGLDAEQVESTLHNLNRINQQIQSNSVRNSKKKVKVKQKDIDNMTDMELRDKINRLNLEKQYKDLNTVYVKSIGDRVSDVISAGTKLAGISLTAITIAKTIKHSDDEFFF